MSGEDLIVAAIGIGAGSYVLFLFQRSLRRMWKTANAETSSACGGCSGCGTPEGHADSEDSCSVRQGELIQVRVPSGKSS